MTSEFDRLSNIIDDLAAERDPSARAELSAAEAELASTAAMLRAGAIDRMSPSDDFVEALAARISAQQSQEQRPSDVPAGRKGLSRRKALQRAVAAIAGVAVGGVGAGAIYEHGKNDGTSQEVASALDAPMVPNDRGEWQNTGYKVSAVAAGSAVRFRAGALEGFLVNPGRSQQLFALSAACTHMGCMISWIDSAGTFLCPCHGAQYNANGTVLSGIARHPLPRLRLNVDSDGDVYVWSVSEHPKITTVAPYNKA
ncbi:MAG: cbcV [Chloroflexi bacterium]|nr:cbcV [Chloroflexota bacterium]